MFRVLGGLHVGGERTTVTLHPYLSRAVHTALAGTARNVPHL
jgi:hypothetical protein